MTRPIAFTDKGIEYRAFPEEGSYFGIGIWNGHQYLSVIAMMADGTPDCREVGSTARNLDDENQTIDRPIAKVYNAGEVTNVDDDQSFVDKINEEFGTKFTLRHFPGR